MPEFTALIAAVVLGSVIAIAATFGSVDRFASTMFNPTADFSAKFIKP